MPRRVSPSKRKATKRLKKYDPRKGHEPVHEVSTSFVDPAQLRADAAAARHKRREQRARAVRRVTSLAAASASADR
jgi:hypothetical protein